MGGVRERDGEGEEAGAEVLLRIWEGMRPPWCAGSCTRGVTAEMGVDMEGGVEEGEEAANAGVGGTGNELEVCRVHAWGGMGCCSG